MRLRVLGIPVRFDTWFFIIGVALSIRAGLAVVLLWLIVLGGSILVHELGHALVARTTGAAPHIVIHALGGYTSWLPPGAVTRSRRIAISLAGPAAGISLGLIFVAARRAGVGQDGGLAGVAISLGIYVNVVYGFFNLLPILPLDGGQTMRDLLPGDEARRERSAAIVSIVVGAFAIAGALLVAHQPIGAVFLALFVAGNVTSLSRGRDSSPPPLSPAQDGLLAQVRGLRAAGDFRGAAAAAELAAAAADHRGEHATAIAALLLAAESMLDASAPAEAKRLLLDLPPGSVPPLLEGRVLLTTGQAALGVDRLAVAFAADPGEQAAYHLAIGLVHTGAAERLIATCTDGRVPALAAISAARGALAAGGFGVAGRLAELAGRRATGADFALAAFTAARAWALAGERERALLALRAAVSADFRYAAAATGDPAFGSVRGDDYDNIVRVPS